MRESGGVWSLVDRAYLARLRSLQNSDGGWGFHAGCESRIEPTSWADEYKRIFNLFEETIGH